MQARHPAPELALSSGVAAKQLDNRTFLFAEFPFRRYPSKLGAGWETIRNSTQCERENNLIETLPQLGARDTQQVRGQL
jgi:hypothetical protein